MSLEHVTLLSVLTLRCIVANVWLQTAIWNKYWNIEAFLEIRNAPLQACVEECQARDRCKAVNYWRVRRNCELLDNDVTNLLKPTDGQPCLAIAKTNLTQEICGDCSRVCDADSNRTTCSVKVCLTPPIGDKNGHFLGNMMHVGARRRLVCDRLSILEAETDKVKCQDDGRWSPAINCTLIVGNFGTDCHGGWTPEGAVVYNNSCYLILHKKRLNFRKAQKFCKLHKSSLIHVDNESESNFIKSYLSEWEEYVPVFWIGMSDEANEGDWRWVDDNSVLTLNLWGPRQPNNYRGNEHCGVFYSDKPGVPYVWNDWPCNNFVIPICKIR